MKKTLTVNLGGIVFNIDEDAYAVLKSYLDTIKGYFDTSEGRDEIMTDIESRIAEMLQEKLNGGKQVINSTDINEIIAIMGQPEDYITEDMDDEPKQTYTRQQSEPYTTTKRRLFRDTDGSVVGGVCSGVGYYFGIDPLWIRLGFVISVLFFGTGFLFYLILWIIMPEARYPSEKLAMKGEPVTFDNIGKTVEDEIKNVKKKLNNLDENQFRPQRDKFHSTISQIADFILSIFKFVIKAIGKILGFVFILVGIIVIISLAFGSIIPLNIMFIDPFEFTEIMFPSGSDFWMAAIGGLLFVGIPFIALILAGFILLFNAKMPKYTGLALAGAWVLGIILAAIGGVSTGFDFAKESTVNNVINLREVPSDTLYFEVLDSRSLISKSDKSRAVRDFFDVRDGILTSEEVNVDIIATKTKYPELEIVKTAHGNTYTAADSRALGIEYGVRTDSNIIKIDPYFTITSEDKWRNQEVKVNLFLPVGKTIYIPKQFRFLLDDVKNYTDTYDGDMVDKYWTMTDSGLVNQELIEQELRLNWEDSDANNSFHMEANEDGLDIKIIDDGEEHTITIGN